MYRRSFLHPTNRTGVCGQNLLISGYHITLQFRKETGLVMEKHSNTTSDLIKPFQLISIRVKIPFGDLTCRMRNVDLSRDRQMCPRDVATRLHCLLPPKISPTPDMYHTMLFNTLLTGYKYTRVFMHKRYRPASCFHMPQLMQLLKYKSV